MCSFGTLARRAREVDLGLCKFRRITDEIFEKKVMNKISTPLRPSAVRPLLALYEWQSVFLVVSDASIRNKPQLERYVLVDHLEQPPRLSVRSCFLRASQILNLADAFPLMHMIVSPTAMFIFHLIRRPAPQRAP